MKYIKLIPSDDNRLKRIKEYFTNTDYPSNSYDSQYYKFFQSDKFKKWINSNDFDYKELLEILKDFDLLISSYDGVYIKCQLELIYILLYVLNYDPIEHILINKESFIPGSLYYAREIIVPDSANFIDNSSISNVGSLYNCKKCIFETKSLKDLGTNIIFNRLDGSKKVEFDGKPYTKAQLGLEIEKQEDPSLFETPKKSGKWFRIADRRSGHSDHILVAHITNGKLGFYFKKSDGCTGRDIPVFFKTTEEVADFLKNIDYVISDQIVYPSNIYEATPHKRTKEEGFVKVETDYGPIYIEPYKRDLLYGFKTSIVKY